MLTMSVLADTTCTCQPVYSKRAKFLQVGDCSVRVLFFVVVKRRCWVVFFLKDAMIGIRIKLLKNQRHYSAYESRLLKQQIAISVYRIWNDAKEGTLEHPAIAVNMDKLLLSLFSSWPFIAFCLSSFCLCGEHWSWRALCNWSCVMLSIHWLVEYSYLSYFRT